MDLRSGECNVVSLYVLCCPVNGSVCSVCCVFVNCLVKQFAICLGVFAILLLKVGVVVCGMLFLCVILHTMSSGKSLQLLCIFPFGMVCLSAISMMFVKILLAVCILVCAKADSVSSVNCVQTAFL